MAKTISASSAYIAPDSAVATNWPVEPRCASIPYASLHRVRAITEKLVAIVAGVRQRRDVPGCERLSGVQ